MIRVPVLVRNLPPRLGLKRDVMADPIARALFSVHVRGTWPSYLGGGRLSTEKVRMELWMPNGRTRGATGEGTNAIRRRAIQKPSSVTRFACDRQRALKGGLVAAFALASVPRPWQIHKHLDFQIKPLNITSIAQETLPW